MSMMEKMMGFMMERMDKDEKKEMMDKMMDKFLSDMTKEDKKEMMCEMMPQMMKMMSGENLSEDIPGPMGDMCQGFDFEERLKMMSTMMPRCMDTMFSKLEPEERGKLAREMMGKMGEILKKYST